MAEPGPSSTSDPAPAPTDRLVRFPTPLSGLFAVNKPSGMVSMSLLNDLQPLFSRSPLFTNGHSVHPNDCTPTGIPKSKKKQAKSRRKPLVKIGQGGTLDPLARGVLVIGLNSATKRLADFLHCTKSYRTTGLLGCETDSYDKMGKVVRFMSWEGVTAEDIEAQCNAMRGPGTQIPPIYAALKMEGKPLYEYARKNIPLPRPIEPRPCDIPEIKLVEWHEGGTHTFRWPTEHITAEDQEMFHRMRAMVEIPQIPTPQPTETSDVKPSPTTTEPLSQPTKRLHSPDIVDEVPSPKKIKVDDTSPQVESSTTSKCDIVTMDDNGRSPAFTLDLTVSSGTYVRTIVHDIGKAVSSVATLVSLNRTRQGEFALEADTEKYPGTNGLGCIDWSVFANAIRAEREGTIDARSEVDGLRDWERELLKKIKQV